ncbi:DUF3530 family protein [Methylophaga muralis]|uniref:Alpha/beta hydrolase family protein n=1 Tax=Methylophaga muralis TaxID=291169 RepID=A0A1E3GU83_9GAMM|nr:DUF3530 family protein [Methylophaga muralis]ODN67603.1 Alpha/beta hydrolase family protein [Methylophaga muralis]
MKIPRLTIPAFFTLIYLSVVLFAGTTESVAADKAQILRQDSVTKGYAPLAVGDQSIAAAYLPQTLGTPRGAVLLLHDINEHIDSAAIGLLRRQLPSHGWNTLAIKIIRFSEINEQAVPDLETASDPAVDAEVPAEADETAESPETEVEEASAETPDTETTDANEETVAPQETFAEITTAQRIDAALLKLQQEGHENIVLIGQGAGGQLALKTVNETAVPVAALIMINTAELAEGMSITDVTVPTLEILGSRQQDNVKQAIMTRQTQMKTEQRDNYHLRQITGADHYFSSVPQQLTNQVHGWLFKQLLDEEAER